MEFIEELQEHGIYMPPSIRALAQFSQSKGVPVWPEDSANVSASIQLERSLASIEQKATPHQSQPHYNTPVAYPQSTSSQSEPRIGSSFRFFEQSPTLHFQRTQQQQQPELAQPAAQPAQISWNVYQTPSSPPYTLWRNVPGVAFHLPFSKPASRASEPDTFNTLNPGSN